MEDLGVRTVVTYVRPPVAESWALLVDAERQGEWYLPCTGLEGRAGGRAAWGPDGGAVVVGEIRAWRPDLGFLAHTFAFTFLDEEPGLVRWRLTRMGGVTQVWLRHQIGGRPRTAGVVSGSWAAVLARFKTLLETGEPLPEPVWPERDGWDRDPAF